MSDVYYKLKNGKWITERELKIAYFIDSGYEVESRYVISPATGMYHIMPDPDWIHFVDEKFECGIIIDSDNADHMDVGKVYETDEITARFIFKHQNKDIPLSLVEEILRERYGKGGEE